MHEDQRAGLRRRHNAGAQTEVRRPAHCVAQRLGRHLARAVNDVDVRRQRDGPVGQPARRRFPARAIGAVAQCVAQALRCRPGLPRHQRGLGQALQVQHHVVAVLLQAGAEGLLLALHVRRPPALAPAPLRTVDHLADALDPAHQRREAWLDHPVDAHTGQCGAQVRHHRHRVDHVAQGRQLDDQDAPHGQQEPSAFNARRPALRLPASPCAARP